jgi:hypothetical protein
MLIRNTTKFLDVMERQIIGNSPMGEKFFLGKNVLQVIEGACWQCFFDGGWRSSVCLAVEQHYDPKCTTAERVDGKSVAFKLVGTIAPDGKIIPPSEPA